MFFVTVNFHFLHLKIKFYLIYDELLIKHEGVPLILSGTPLLRHNMQTTEVCFGK